MQAKRSKYADDIFVSTESKEISNLCKKLRVKVINRPSELCRDTSSSESAIKHAIKKIDFKIDNIIFLQATSPLRKKNDIDKAFKIFLKSKSDSLFSAHKAEDFFDIWKSKKNFFSPLTIDYKKRKPRQVFFQNHFMQNGSIYIFKKKLIEKHNNRLGGKIMVYEMDDWQSFQLDSLKQKKVMELLFSKFLKKTYE